MMLRARLAGAWALMHPGPSLMTVAVYMLCAVLASGGHPAPGKLALSGLGMVCMQFAISALNDYCDRAADASNPQKRKPLVTGAISPPFALWAAIILAAAMVVLFIPYGPVSLALACVFLALGFAYDLGVKSTPFSGLMLGLAFPTIPLLAWDIFARLTPALFTALPLGLFLGIGLHLADALPDAEADAAAGVRGLTQVLGNYAPLACWIAFASAIILCAVLIPFTPTPPRQWVVALVGIGATLLLLVAIFTFRAPNLPDGAHFKRHFLLLVTDALLLVVAWFLAVAV